MSRGQSKRLAGALAGCLFVLAVQAIGGQIDSDAERDDQCRAQGLEYSHQHRACIKQEK